MPRDAVPRSIEQNAAQTTFMHVYRIYGEVDCKLRHGNHEYIKFIDLTKGLCRTSSAQLSSSLMKKYAGICICTQYMRAKAMSLEERALLRLALDKC